MADENKNVDENQPEQVSDTGHSWDGIRELTNPCPRWWLNSLYLSGLLVLVYFILYPSLPLINGSSKGLLGWTQMTEYKEDLAEIEARRAPFEEKFAAMTVPQVLADQEMLNYVTASSKVLFGDNCAACHGVGGQAAEGLGYPVLADDDWLYGGSVDQIMMSIANGRQGAMPAHEGLMSNDEVNQLTQFVIDSSNGVLSEAGKALYMEQGCYACHGDDAKGIKEIGSANLTDKLWRFSGDFEEIRYTILHGVNDEADPKTRQAIMPQWNQKLALMLQAKADAIADKQDPRMIEWNEVLEGDETERLTESDIKKLTIYVHQLGGGQFLSQ